jgi:hypothetical protein
MFFFLYFTFFIDPYSFVSDHSLLFFGFWTPIPFTFLIPEVLDLIKDLGEEWPPRVKPNEPTRVDSIEECPIPPPGPSWFKKTRSGLRTKKEAKPEPQEVPAQAEESSEESSESARGDCAPEPAPAVKTEVDYGGAEEESEEETARPARRLDSRSSNRSASPRARAADRRRSYTLIRPTRGDWWRDPQSESEVRSFRASTCTARATARA